MRLIFLSPHNDDETLFGAFTIMRYRFEIEVVVVYDAYVQVSRGFDYCTKDARRLETTAALEIMGVRKPATFLGFNDEAELNLEDVTNVLTKYRDDCRVFAPAVEVDGNRHHSLVGRAAAATIPKERVASYLTYTGSGKSTSNRIVQPAYWGDIARKHLALACYESQIQIPDCQPHFLRSQEEYYAV